MSHTNIFKIAAFFLCHAWCASSSFGDAPVSSAEDFIGGTTSVGSQLQLDDQVAGEPLLEPWHVFKSELKERAGFDFSIDYATLYQVASDSLTGNDDAFSGVFRFYGKWELLGRGSKNTGSLVWKVENREKLGGDVVPGALGGNLGYLGVVGASFTDAGWFMAPLYWEQFLADGRVGLVAGRIDSLDFVDISGYTGQWRRFQNGSLLVNSTIPYPDVGLGAGAGGKIGDDWVLGATIHDANGAVNEFDFLVDGAEFFKQAYLSWSPDRSRRLDRAVHLTVWHADERTERGIDDGWGVGVSANWLFDNGLMPFVRLGLAEGEAARADGTVVLGALYRPANEIGELGLAFGWESLSDDSLGDQKALEAFFRWDVNRNFSLTPSLQVLIDPALNPSDDIVLVGGVRARFNF